MADLRRNEEREQDWKAVPGFPEYEVNGNRQVRRTTTKAPTQPYRYILRPNEGEFVDFWINGQKHIISLDAIMNGTFSNKEQGN